MIRFPRPSRVGRTLALAAFAALAAAPALAQAQDVIFKGRGFLWYSEACRQGGGSGGPEEVSVHFMPAGVGRNPNRERLTVVLGPILAQSYVAQSGPFTSSFQPVLSGRTHWETSFHDVQARLRVTRKVPGRITAATPRVVLEGEIRNFDDVVNCTARFHLHAVRRR